MKRGIREKGIRHKLICVAARPNFNIDERGMKSYRDLIVWQKSMNLVTQVYQAIRSFPKEEMYGLTNQIRRCAVSVPSNMAEGYGRQASGDYIRHLQISRGSLFELQTQLEICRNIQYLSKREYDDLFELCNEIERMLNSLIKKLKEKA